MTGAEGFDVIVVGAGAAGFPHIIVIMPAERLAARIGTSTEATRT